nr:hypothetical protein [Pseudoclavibacter helvolus]
MIAEACATDITPDATARETSAYAAGIGSPETLIRSRVASATFTSMFASTGFTPSTCSNIAGKFRNPAFRATVSDRGVSPSRRSNSPAISTSAASSTRRRAANSCTITTISASGTPESCARASRSASTTAVSCGD